MCGLVLQERSPVRLRIPLSTCGWTSIEFWDKSNNDTLTNLLMCYRIGQSGRCTLEMSLTGILNVELCSLGDIGTVKRTLFKLVSSFPDFLRHGFSQKAQWALSSQ